jgi:NADH-quinone oxidoreductase subunit H
MAEAEQELVGGYHTEYSAMRFALFFLGEYAGMITTSAVCVAFFFGGWHLPWIEWVWPALKGNVDPTHPAITTSIIACVVRSAVFFGKTLFLIFVFMWVRWTLPRLRFDQLMMLAWRALIPISLAIVMMTAIVIFAYNGRSYLKVDGSMALTFLVANIALAFLILLITSLLPPAPATNRRLTVLGSRFNKPPTSLAGAASAN